MSTISIIILNYNDFETTNLMINKIKDYKVINHIIVVDNCSTDNSFKELSKIKDGRVRIYDPQVFSRYGWDQISKNICVWSEYFHME